MLNYMPLHKEPQKERDLIDQAFLNTAKEKARMMAEEALLKSGQILPLNVLQERFEKELEQEFTTFRKRLQNGSAKILESLQQLSIHHPELLAEDVTDAFTHISGLSEDIEKDEQAFNEKIAQGVSLQELAQVSDETIDKLYQAAKNLYELKNYNDASDAFLFLTNINPKKFAFWLGLANALYCLKRYEEAIPAYTNAYTINPSNPNCYLYASYCHSACGEIEKAINTIDLALQTAEETKEFADWKPSLQEEKRRLGAIPR